MPAVELPSLAIVLLYLVVVTRLEGVAALRRLAVLCACGLLAEHTVVQRYGFYAYSEDWSIFVGNVPLLVGVIWPVVVDSARRLATGILGDRAPGIPLLTGAIVAADAGLIEPIAVASGLWTWTQPGLFGVPVIGMLGWGVFAYWATRLLTPGRGVFRRVFRLGLVVAATHVTLVLAWTLALRFLAYELPPAVCLLVLWSAAIAAAAVLRRTTVAPPTGPTLVRALAAAFFFWLLVRHGHGVSLWLWSLAFPLPYLALLRRR